MLSDKTSIPFAHSRSHKKAFESRVARVSRKTNQYNHKLFLIEWFDFFRPPIWKRLDVIYVVNELQHDD